MSNTTFVFSWGAPYSLDVTDCSPDIFYYTLCTNITIYGCKHISSDPDCTFPRTCTTSLDYNGLLINGSQNTTVIVHGGPIKFTLYTVNGAGNGNVTTATYVGTERTETGLYVCTVMHAIGVTCQYNEVCVLCIKCTFTTKQSYQFSAYVNCKLQLN